MEVAENNRVEIVISRNPHFHGQGAEYQKLLQRGRGAVCRGCWRRRPRPGSVGVQLIQVEQVQRRLQQLRPHLAQVDAVQPGPATSNTSIVGSRIGGRSILR